MKAQNIYNLKVFIIYVSLIIKYLNLSSPQLMAGGPAFLRPVNEFTTRLCYVNFDGKDTLEQSMKLGLDQPLPEDFVQNFARPVYDGTMVGHLKNIINNEKIK